MIVRVQHRAARPYVVLDQSTLRLTTLSLKARGLWALCMSYPPDWEVRLGHLATQSARDGRDAVRSALRELEAHGLASLDVVREGGRLAGRRWTVYEIPELRPEKRSDRPTGESDVRAARVSGRPTQRSMEAHGVSSTYETGSSTSTLAALLHARGLGPAAAAALVSRWPARVEPMVARFDAENARGASLSAGWLRRAIERGYRPLDAPAPAEPLRYGGQVLAWLAARGLDASALPLYFEEVAADAWGPRFRLRPEASAAADSSGKSAA